MWFARLFGGRDDGSNDELPTATAPQRPVPGPSVAAVTCAPPVQNSTKAVPKKPAGFDPYNSGTFERGKAWERIGRR
ncbi:hypothetical protein [Povalibacter sp.]|uniref:hypothetical protein n=1 Tax=Povalibacter sp. TaxID=1962978 RepID=UPI002F40B842